MIKSSEILVYISNDTLYIANLGDTRAVIASLSADKSLGRKSLVSQLLTEEHRPEYTIEFDRITKMGGRVQKLIDINGNHQGPYRVWESNRNLPGLTVSRSISSSRCKNIGIIADPSTYSYCINKDKDFFLVIASDGIWDVMQNQEVINFVEAFREPCVKGIDVCPDEEFVCFLNTCIAQLLCEEARMRWILKIEDEQNDHIDDISCIVVEFKKSDQEIEVVQDAGIKNINLEENKEIEYERKKAPTIIDFVVKKQTRRASLVGVSVLNSKTEM